MSKDRPCSVLLSSLLILSLLAPLLVSVAITSVVTVEASPSENWVVVSHSPQIKDYAVAVVGAGENIYIANSRTTAGAEYFMRYNTITGIWNYLSVPPVYFSFKNGVDLAWDNGNYIYALLGASYSDIDAGGRFYFYRYSISDNSWTKLENTPHTCGAGDAIYFVPGWVMDVDNDNFLYAILGSGKPSGSQFHRFSVASGSWSTALSFPWNKTDDGCSLVWTGDNYLYALRGEWQETTPCYDFWRYNIIGGTWENRENIPAYPHGELGGEPGEGGVGDGGSLVWVGGSHSNYIYALSGNQCYPEPIWDNRFYRYTISTNSWERLADLPAGVGYQNGPRLGFANDSIYCWRGCNNDNVLWAYTVKNEGSPTRPVLISPENNTSTSDNTPTFVWTRGSNADNHRIEVDNDSNFSSPIDNVVVASPNDNTWTKPSPGYANGTYYWRVWARNSYGENVSENTWQFTVVSIDVSIDPEYLSGSPGDTLNYTVTVTNTGAENDNFDLKVSDSENWGLTLSENLLEIPAGENRQTTLSVTIPENAVPCTEDKITVVATSRADNTVKDNDTCITHAIAAQVNLVAGWNLVGFTGVGENDTPDKLFSGLTYTMYYWEAPYGPYNEPNYSAPVEDNRGYWVKVNQDKTVWTSGTSPDNRTIYLVAGWNLVHFPLTSENTTPDNLFAGLSYTMYYWEAPYGPYNEPPHNQPVKLGVGYWVYLNVDKTITVPL